MALRGFAIVAFVAGCGSSTPSRDECTKAVAREVLIDDAASLSPELGAAVAANPEIQRPFESVEEARAILDAHDAGSRGAPDSEARIAKCLALTRTHLECVLKATGHSELRSCRP